MSLRRHLIGAVAAVALGVTVCGPAHGQGAVARMELVGGDRQILSNTYLPPPIPYVVRATDAAGIPVAGVGVLIMEAVYCSSPGIAFRDEFGFFGFGQMHCQNIGDSPYNANQAVTDANGLASVNARLLFVGPVAFLVAVSPRPGNTFTPVFFSVVKVAAFPPPGNPTVLIEYFNSAVGHYFNTSIQGEIDALEANAFPGWKRSVGSFVGYASRQDAPLDAVPVCRFFSSTYTSHFYTADPGECDAVVANWPDVWTLETRNAFYIQVPDKATGACGAGLQPIYRMYSTRNGPNHRYVADSNLRYAMMRAGWVSEGYGPDNVMLCTAK